MRHLLQLGVTICQTCVNSLSPILINAAGALLYLFGSVAGKLARRTASTPSSTEKLTSASFNSTVSGSITKPFRQKDPGVVELERKAAILDEVTGFINSQTKLSSLTAADITDYLTTVFSRNYILTAEKTQLQAELIKRNGLSKVRLST